MKGQAKKQEKLYLFQGNASFNDRKKSQNSWLEV